MCSDCHIWMKKVVEQDRLIARLHETARQLSDELERSKSSRAGAKSDSRVEGAADRAGERRVARMLEDMGL
jgi:hypothetical protein